MRNIFKTILIAAVGVAMSSGCIKETFPQGGTVTGEQVGASASAFEATLAGLPSQLTQTYLIYGDQTSELDIAYPGLLMMYNELLGDFFPGGTAGYDHFQSFNICKGMAPTGYPAYIPWRTLYMFIKSANNIIGSVDETTATKDQLEKVGMAYAYRAFWYFNLMNMYEPVENEYTDVSALLGLTVPIVTEKTTEAEAKNNPRASHDDMVKFILDDLAKAEEYLAESSGTSRLYPSLPVVHGIKAKVYMSDGRYADAQASARAAIDAFNGAPMSEGEWHNPTTGFVEATNAWMWYCTYSAENIGNLGNWVGWISAEADWGYSSLTKPAINRALYDRIPESDWRKYSWLDPDKTKFYEYQTIKDNEWIEKAPAYMSLKFRCVGGDSETYTVGGLADVPMMRIEEMYYIEAEAIGLQEGKLADGVAALNEFVSTYRNPEYECSAADVAAFQDEILFQKKIEFWGEGIAFFDAKRMRAGTLQSYEGTNAPSKDFKLNCVGIKPNWNFVIPQTEVSNNPALKGFENPDPTSKVTPEN